MPSRRPSNKSRRPRRRQIRRPGPPLSVVRVSFLPDTTNFAVQKYGSPFQGFGIDVPFNQLLAFSPASSAQNVIVADSRLVFLRVVLPPIGTSAPPLGVDVLLKGFPQLDTDGTVVGHTNKFLSTTTSTAVNCRLPPSVTQFYVGRPETDSKIMVRIQFRYYEEEPSSGRSKYLPPVTVEMKFRQQPIETMILR